MENTLDKSGLGIETLLCIWWFIEAVATIKTRQLMTPDAESDDGATTYTQSKAFTDLRWLELTCLQHVIGGVILCLVFIWLRFTNRCQSRSTEGSSPHKNGPSSWMALIVPVISHIVGGCALNAAYSLLSATTTQAVKTFEPLIGTLLISVGYKVTISTPVLYSLFVMNVGAVVFAGSGISGILCWLPAVLSSVCLVGRDVTLQRWNACEDMQTVVRQYSIISICSGALLIPILYITRMFYASPEFSSSYILAPVPSHIVYTVITIAFLHSSSFSAFVKQNLAARFFVMLVCMAYFPRNFTWISHLGLGIMFSGALLYSKASKNCEIDRRKATVIVCALCALVAYLALDKLSMVPSVL